MFQNMREDCVITVNKDKRIVICQYKGSTILLICINNLAQPNNKPEEAGMSILEMRTEVKEAQELGTRAI